MPAVHVVLVDDDELFRESLSLNLRDEGFGVTTFADGPSMLRYFEEDGNADLVLLDWRMPEVNGLEVLRRLRQMGETVPVVFLTVLSDNVYEEAALEGGAVDFVEKSRSLPILIRRIRLIIGGGRPAAAGEEADRTVRHGKLELRLDTRRAYWNEVPVPLTLTEFNIVRALIANTGEDIPYRRIYDMVHGEGFVAGSGAQGYRTNVRSFIKRIRQKFRDIDEGFDRIENYPGFGYRWLDDGNEA